MSFVSKNPLLLAYAQQEAAGGISRSLRFNSSDSAFCSRTPSSAGNRRTWTLSLWVKRSGLGAYQRIFNSRNPGVAADYIRFNNDDTLELYLGAALITTQVFRDPSSWYHLVIAVDTTQATSGNRVKLYVNGSQVSTFGTANYPSQNADTLFNATLIHTLGTGDGTTEYFSGYLADIIFVDGQALTPSSFTEVSATTGQLIPKAYTGTFGTNGFWLKFADNSGITSTTLGKDSSPNGNNWTPNNFSVTETSSAIFNAALNATPFTDGSASSVSITNNGSIGITTAGTNSFSISNAASFSGGSASGLTTGSAFNRTGLYTLDVYFKCTLAQQSRFLTNDGTNTGQGLAIATDGSINCYDFGNAVLAPAGAVSANTWYHFRLIANGSTVLASYLNGSAQTVSGSLSNFAANTALRIGWGETGVSHSFGGLLGPTRITAANLGKPPSGGLSTTSGTISNNPYAINVAAGNDSLVDTPTSYGTDTGAGGEVRGNYCTFNPLDAGSGVTISDGNLRITGNANSRETYGSIGVSSGKWYFEATITTASTNNDPIVSVARSTISRSSTSLVTADGWGLYLYAVNTFIQKGNNNTFTNTNTTKVNDGDVIGIAFDVDAGKIWASKNGTWIDSGIPSTGSNPLFSNLSGTLMPGARAGGASTGTTTTDLNFGQRPFAYTAPSGFKALCDTNLPAPVVAKPNTVMDVITYTGTGSSLALPNGSSTPTSISFTPDFAWIKGRSGATDHALYDAVRGVQKDLVSNSTSAETTETTGLTAFGTNTFTVGSLAKLNTSSSTYVAWAWNAGGSTVTNTQGSITSSVRANTSAGFSVVTYVGTGGTGGTVGHGLGVAPSLIIAKSRSASRDWAVYHKDLTKDKYLNLNSTAAASTTASVWGNAEPTSTVFGVYAWSTAQNNANGENMVAYCFAPVSGYSSFGSYTGNGSADGPFVYTGFRPRWILIKNTSATGFWILKDTARDPANTMAYHLAPNSSDADYYDLSLLALDSLSNGFKVRNNNSGHNTNGNVYVYAAFAESPFQFSRAR